MIDFSKPGRMISPSKSEYLHAHTNHVVVFNANVCTKAKGKLWNGDLDVTLDADELRRLARELDEEVYVLRERDARFASESNPAFENAVARITPDGKVRMSP